MVIAELYRIGILNFGFGFSCSFVFDTNDMGWKGKIPEICELCSLCVIIEMYKYVGLVDVCGLYVGVTYIVRVPYCKSINYLDTNVESKKRKF